MTSYTAHLKPEQPPILHAEGWSWGAFLFGPVWLAAHRAWIPALLGFALLTVLVVLAPSAMVTPLLVSFAVLNGLLGVDAVRWSLERRGYALGHIVLAPNHDAALLRLFAARPDLVGSGA